MRILKIKIKNLFFLSLFGMLLPYAAVAENLILKSFGHSNFLIKGGGQSILLNPFKSVGCASHLNEQNNLEVDFILASSRLKDEGYNPSNILMFVDPGSYRVNEIILNGISIPHDRIEGRRFGMATVWAWQQNELKIVHMGGAAGGINISDQILLSGADILFISVGGGTKSYNGIEASKMVKKLKPKIVIPVHFIKEKKSNENCELNNADLFLENMSDFKVKYVGKNFEINPNKIDSKMIYIFSN